MKNITAHLIGLLLCILSQLAFSFEGLSHTYASLLLDKAGTKVRLGAKGIEGEGHPLNQETHDLAAKILWLGIHGEIGFDSDTLSWLAKAVGASNSQRYSSLMGLVLEKTTDEKVKAYITKSKGKLKKPSESEFDPNQVDLDQIREKLQTAIETSRKNKQPNQSKFATINNSTHIEDIYDVLGLPDSVNNAYVPVRRPYVGTIFEERLMISYNKMGDFRFTRRGGDWLVDQIRADITLTIDGMPVDVEDISENSRFIEYLTSNNPQTFRSFAKRLYNKDRLSEKALDVIAQRVWLGRNDRDKTSADGLAWLCKTIIKLGNSRYHQAFKTIYNEASSKKVKKHAKKVFKALPLTDIEQFEIDR